jgi:hypothetical protein
MFQGEQCYECLGIYDLSAVGGSYQLRSFSFTVSEHCYIMAQYPLEQFLSLNNIYVKYGSARKCRRKFLRKFHDERVPSRQTIHNLVNKLRSTGVGIDKKQTCKRRVLTEENLDDIGATLEQTPR